MRKYLSTVGIVAAMLLVAGCSTPAPTEPTGEAEPSEPTTPLTFQLNWVAGGSMAGYSTAQAAGFYEDNGLDVTIVPGNGAANTAQLVASGQAKIGAADGTTAAQLIAKGAPITVVATIYQSNANSVQSLVGSGIKTVDDLVGRTVGVPSGSSQTTMLPLLFEANDIDVSEVNLVNMPPASMVQALLQGEVDAILGSTDSYGIQLDQQEGGEHIDIPFATNGVPTVGTSIIVNSDWLKDNGDTVKAFVAASLDGWRLFSEDVDAAVEAVTSQYSSANPELVKAESEVVLEQGLLCAGDAEFVGKAQPEQWELLQELLSKVGLLPAGIDPTAYYTYDYLPADADMQSCPLETP